MRGLKRADGPIGRSGSRSKFSRRAVGVMTTAANTPTETEIASAAGQPHSAAIGRKNKPRQGSAERSAGLLDRENQAAVPRRHSRGKNAIACRRRRPVAQSHHDCGEREERPPAGCRDREATDRCQGADLEHSDRSEPRQNRTAEHQEQDDPQRAERRDDADAFGREPGLGGQQRRDDRKALIQEGGDALHPERCRQSEDPERNLRVDSILSSHILSSHGIGPRAERAGRFYPTPCVANH